jgi:hypothetical protein
MILEGMSKFYSETLTIVCGSLTCVSPTVGELLLATPEEIIITPSVGNQPKGIVDSRIHFPRLGFVVRPVSQQKL